MTRNAPDVKITPIRASAIARSPGSRATTTAPAVAARNHDSPYAGRLVAIAPAFRGSSGSGRTGSGMMTSAPTRYMVASAVNAIRNPVAAMRMLAASGPANCPIEAVIPRRELAASKSSDSTIRVGSALLAGLHSDRAAPQATAMMSRDVRDPETYVPSDVAAEHV